MSGGERTQSAREGEGHGDLPSRDRHPVATTADEPSRLGELADWQRVAANDELAEAVRGRAGEGEPPVAVIAHLRRRWSEVEVRIALHLQHARHRARAKFSDAERLLCDREGVEQASSERVASWKAKRYAVAIAGLREPRVVDLCSGIGGDAMALARCAPTLVVDRSPIRAWMAGTNANAPSLVAMVEVEHGHGAFVHIDPARRVEGGGDRRLTPIHTPSLEHCAAIARASCGGAIKVGPGTEPASLPADATLEWISDHGTLVQLVAWMGGLAEPIRAALALQPSDRIATRIASGTARDEPATHVRVGREESVPLHVDGDIDRYLYVPDPALERSRLLGSLARELGLTEAAIGLGIVSGPRRIESPWLSGYEVLDEVRADERSIAAALLAHGATDVRVRTRGGSADADHLTRDLRKRLRGDATSATTLDAFVLRVGSTRRAFICRPA